jgi:hypothetical protein
VYNIIEFGALIGLFKHVFIFVISLKEPQKSLKRALNEP